MLAAPGAPGHSPNISAAQARVTGGVRETSIEVSPTPKRRRLATKKPYPPRLESATSQAMVVNVEISGAGSATRP